MVEHERRLDQLRLAGLVVDLAQYLARAPDLQPLDAEPVGDHARLLDRHRGVHVGAGVLLDQVDHARTPERRRQFDLAARQADDGRAVGGEGRFGDERLRQLHHVAVVAEGLVGLQQRELGVVACVQPLVAEDAADFEDAVHAADEQPLERELERDPQAHLDIEGVVVGEERLRGRAAGLAQQHRCLDLAEASLDQHAAHRGDRSRARCEHRARPRIDYEVDVAAAIAHLGIGEPVAHVGQRAQRLGQELDAVHTHRELARGRRDHPALGADPVAEVEAGDVVEGVVAELVARGEQLDRAGLVHQVDEIQPAVAAQAHHAPGNPHRLVGLRPRGQ